MPILGWSKASSGSITSASTLVRSKILDSADAASLRLGLPLERAEPLYSSAQLLDAGVDKLMKLLYGVLVGEPRQYDVHHQLVRHRTR